MELSPSLETIFDEERQEIMVSPTDDDSKPTLRPAHFLKPTASTRVLDLPPHYFCVNVTASTKLPLRILCPCWTRPQNDWIVWVQKLQPRYEPLWKQVGIYDAIILSTHELVKHHELIIALAEKWCLETNSFIFPWGEATITLEDIMVNVGFPLVGEAVSEPCLTVTQRIAEDYLIQARGMMAEGRGTTGVYASYSTWSERFMDSGTEFEHEAFLSLWLSKFVLRRHSDCYGVQPRVFPLAILLAGGIQLALAPAVLSSIYTDLGLLKDKLLVVSTNTEMKCKVCVYAPFQFVQIWAWERFPFLRPSPKAIQVGEPRAVRWRSLRKRTSIETVRMGLDMAGESFQWRPYARTVENWSFPKFYGDKEQWITVDPDMDEEFMSFALCVRVSELVGLDGLLQHYLPHRVARQFGLDQDLPGLFSRCNINSKVAAWSNYVRPIRDAKLYVPPRLFEADVTLRYLEWWEKPRMALTDAIQPHRKQPRNSRRLPRASMRKNMDEHDPAFLSPPLAISQSETQVLAEPMNKDGNDLRSFDSYVETISLSQRLKTLASLPEDFASGKVKQMAEEETKHADIRFLSGWQHRTIPSSLAQQIVVNIINREEDIRSESESESFYYCMHEVPVPDLEARIEKLEKKIAELKAGRGGNKVH